MMQTLTKTELAWIYEAMKREVYTWNDAMKQCESGSPAYYLAELKRDNARSVMHKIHTAMNNGSKRIQIK